VLAIAVLGAPTILSVLGASAFSPGELGAFFLVYSISLVLSIVIDFGLSYIVLAEFRMRKPAREEILILLALRLLLLLVVCWTLPLVHFRMGAVDRLFLLLLTIPGALTFVQNGAVASRAIKPILAAGTLQLVVAYGSLIGCIVVRDLHLFVYGFCAGRLIASLVLLGPMLSRDDTGRSARSPAADLGWVSRTSTRGAKMFVNAAMGVVFNWFGFWLIAWLTSTQEAGRFRVAQGIGAIAGVMQQYFQYQVTPSIAESFSRSSSAALDRAVTYLRHIRYLSLIVLLYAITAIPYYLEHYAHTDFRDAKIPAILMVSSYLLGAISMPLYSLMISSSNETSLVNISVVSAFATVLINFGLVPRFGAIGAAISAVLSVSIGLSLLIVRAAQICGRSVFTISRWTVVPASAELKVVVLLSIGLLATTHFLPTASLWLNSITVAFLLLLIQKKFDQPPTQPFGARV